jgi:DNA modification methylase
MSDQTEIKNIESSETRIDTFKFDKPNPIKGYPELHWQGKRPFRSTQYYPAQLKETYGEPKDGWMNKIFWGDNLQVMSHLLKEYRGRIDLIYIDPPFDSKADYKMKIELRGRKTTNDHMAFEEKQYGDIWTNDGYLQFMYERLVLMRELLSDTGSIYVHCDYHMNSFLRLIMDELFGPGNIINEVIWCYTQGGRPIDGFPNKHDNIYLYAKNISKFVLNKNDIKIPYDLYSDKSSSAFTRVDTDGRKFYTKWVNEKEYKYYLDEGKNPYDWWSDIPKVTGRAAVSEDTELVNYPTQKPEKLLSRIIKASSNSGDIIFDCFMGSGTTQAVSMKLGRRFIGADINLGAIQVTSKRLLSVAKELHETTEGQSCYTGFEVYNVNNYDVFRNPVQAKELLIKALEVQPLPSGSIWDGEKDGKMVKVMPVNRVACKADLEELRLVFGDSLLEKRSAENPTKSVLDIELVCMGHEPDLAVELEKMAHPIKITVEVIDILKGKDLQFKRDSEAKIVIDNGKLLVKSFYPMNLLGKLSLDKTMIGDWRELVDSIMIDFNYDGAVLNPTVIDVPDKKSIVVGSYLIPADNGHIRVKITDLLSESIEIDIEV